MLSLPCGCHFSSSAVETLNENLHLGFFFLEGKFKKKIYIACVGHRCLDCKVMGSQKAYRYQDGQKGKNFHRLVGYSKRKRFKLK